MIYRSICPIIRACIWPGGALSLSPSVYDPSTRLKRNLAFRSRWLRHGLIRLAALSGRRLHALDCVCVLATRGRTCACTLYTQTHIHTLRLPTLHRWHTVRSHDRTIRRTYAYESTGGRVYTWLLRRNQSDCAMQRSHGGDWYGIVRHNQRWN